MVFALSGMRSNILSSILPRKSATALVIDSDKRCAALPVGATKEMFGTIKLPALLALANIKSAASNLVTV